jgi:hypothetical protein
MNLKVRGILFARMSAAERPDKHKLFMHRVVVTRVHQVSQVGRCLRRRRRRRRQA